MRGAKRATIYMAWQSGRKLCSRRTHSHSVKVDKKTGILAAKTDKDCMIGNVFEHQGGKRSIGIHLGRKILVLHLKNKISKDFYSIKIIN